MLKADFNDSMNFFIEDNKVTMKLNDGLDGLEFETIIHEISENKITHTINYIKDVTKNRTYRHRKFTEKYSTWVASIIFKLQKENIFNLQ